MGNITNTVKMCIFEVMSDNFQLMEICTSGNYAQKQVTNLYALQY